jgi:glycosyltransferase involved in cell wall biosynthesis
MRIVLFCHPGFMRSQSMPRFANMLHAAYTARGIEVRKWAPQPVFRKWFRNEFAGKWAGYIDQYILFPMWVRRQLKQTPADTLFVFCDQALGPWVPLVVDRPHVVHAHDLLALRSALGDIPENPTSLTGRIYQRYIRRGARHGRHFIAISNKTRDDLHRFMGVNPAISEVVYNGLNYPYSRLPPDVARETLTAAGMPIDSRGILMHIGGAQWYKNLPGVIALYARYAAAHSEPLPLWCVSPPARGKVLEAMRAVPAAGRVLFFQNVENRTLQALYSQARALLFPSLEEGFGWPLIEAAACGCPVLTTDRPPMNEIAGPRATYVARLRPEQDLQQWAAAAAEMLNDLLSRSESERNADVKQAAQWVERFDADRTIDRYLEIYQRVISMHATASAPEMRSPTGVAS